MIDGCMGLNETIAFNSRTVSQSKKSCRVFRPFTDERAISLFHQHRSTSDANNDEKTVIIVIQSVPWQNCLRASGALAFGQIFFHCRIKQQVRTQQAFCPLMPSPENDEHGKKYVREALD